MLFHNLGLNTRFPGKKTKREDVYNCTKESLLNFRNCAEVLRKKYTIFFVGKPQFLQSRMDILGHMGGADVVSPWHVLILS